MRLHSVFVLAVVTLLACTDTILVAANSDQRSVSKTSDRGAGQETAVSGRKLGRGKRFLRVVDSTDADDEEDEDDRGDEEDEERGAIVPASAVTKLEGLAGQTAKINNQLAAPIKGKRQYALWFLKGYKPKDVADLLKVPTTGAGFSGTKAYAYYMRYVNYWQNWIARAMGR
ncbi:hypothetical protein PHYBOEH_011053 [Phytophthora boehmeriae]|uniref:RxLR effector protein n=1 Tax=Phytophthora boehmeriae TaxID=109152 RepID=A0A8T1X8T0_9STRA|nr:hypothetical protein PHYBOEH_011053 [Phytophthora boehmeriae]